ncbi:MAG: cytochrome c peroxidase [Bacteroidota bacterium]
MNKMLLVLATLLLLITACTSDVLENPIDAQLEQALNSASNNQGANYFVLPDEEDLAAIPQDPANPLTQEKVHLGRMLFYETGLALDAKQELGMGTYSCASCHIPSAGFMPGRIQGIADGGIGIGQNGEGRLKYPTYEDTDLDVQGARPLSMLNVAFVTNSTWAGQFGAGGVNEGTEYAWTGVRHVNHLGFSGLESQNIEGLDLHRMIVNKEVMDRFGYTKYYDAAFPDFPEEERYSKITTSFALSAYLRTLLTTESPWQQYLKGDQGALSQEEKNGALLFFSKARCYTCHTGPALNSMRFYALGVNDLCDIGGLATGADDERNFGRGGFTGKEEDMFKFKVPQLYNLADSPFYFHGSSKQSLEEVVQYFNVGEPENARVPLEQIPPHLRPLNLTTEEVADITSFLEKSLRDPNLDRYVPAMVLSGNCYPNNDVLSKAELGCE